MARLVAIIVAVAVLIVASLATRHEAPSTAVEVLEAPIDHTLLSEVDVLIAERNAVFSGCDEGSTDDDLETRKDEWDQLQRQVVSVLEASADAEHLLVAALLTWRDEPDRALQLLGEATARDPSDPLIASQLLELCIRFSGQCSRPRTEVEQKLIAADRANGLAWVQVARSRLERSDEEGAIAAMKEAVAAATIEEYFADYVLLFDRALAASADLSAYERFEGAFGFSAAMVSSSYQITADCTERATSSAEWQDACLRLGERLEHGSRTLLGKGIGFGLQKQMYNLAGNTRQYDLVSGRYEVFRNEYRELTAKSTQALELRDATVTRKYVETLNASDELAAMRYVAEEVQSRLPGSDPAQQSTCSNP